MAKKQTREEWQRELDLAVELYIAQDIRRRKNKDQIMQWAQEHGVDVGKHPMLIVYSLSGQRLANLFAKRGVINFGELTAAEIVMITKRVAYTWALARDIPARTLPAAEGEQATDKMLGMLDGMMLEEATAAGSLQKVLEDDDSN